MMHHRQATLISLCVLSIGVRADQEARKAGAAKVIARAALADGDTALLAVVDVSATNVVGSGQGGDRLIALTTSKRDGKNRGQSVHVADYAEDGKLGLSADWHGALAYDPRAKKLYAVGLHFQVRWRIALYETDLSKPLGSVKTLSKLAAFEVGEPTAPLSKLLHHPTPGRAGRVERLDLIPERSGLMLVVQRRDNPAPLYLRYDFESKDWRWFKPVAQELAADVYAKERGE